MKGHDFSRAEKANKSRWALAPEGGFSGNSSSIKQLFKSLSSIVVLFIALTSGHCTPAPQDPSQNDSQPQQAVRTTAFAPVRGVVHNSATGQPLPRVLVKIEGDAEAGALTDGGGRFEFPAVPVGAQSFRLLKPGFHDRPYASEDVAYQADGPARSVLVAAMMPELVFSLTPSCVIYGHVDLSTGDPTQGMTVTLVKRVMHNGRAVWAQNGTTKTNGEGAYRFASLPAGVYVVFTQPAMESEPEVTPVVRGRAASVARGGYRSAFYPDAHDFAGASRIRLASGEQAQANLSLTLEAFHTVMATAYFPSGRPFVPNAPSESGLEASLQAVSVMDASGHRLPYTGQFDAESHTIQVSLPDGAYTLMVSVTTNDPNMDTSGRANQRSGGYSGFVQFWLAGNAAVNLRIPLARNPSWPVRLRAERTSMRAAQSAGHSGQRLQSIVTVSTTDAGDLPADAGAGSGTAEAAGPDVLELNGAGMGPVWLNAQVNDRSMCVASFTAGGTNLAREPLNLSLAAAPPAMELTLRDDCSSLALELPPALADFVPGEEPTYTVYVVPEFDTTADIPPIDIHPSSGPTRTLDGLTPGSYHVYVFDRPVRFEYRNPAVLAELRHPGQSVTLSPGSTSNLVLEAP